MAKVNYMWDEVPDDELKEQAYAIFMSLRNVWADAINLHIDEWNQEFKNLGGKISEGPDSQYNRFMRQKHQEQTDAKLNDLLCKLDLKYEIKVVVTEECDFSLWIRHVNEKTWYKLEYDLTIV